MKGLIAGASLMSRAFIAKRFVLRLEPEMFRLVMDGIMLAAGLSMLANAFLARITLDSIKLPNVRKTSVS